MAISQSLIEKIEARIEEFLSADSPKLEDVRQIVAKFRVLPLMYDWSGAWAIRPGGEIVTFDYDPPYNLEIEHDLRIRNIALFEGSKKYPELEELVPIRSPDSIKCPHCKGTGIVQEFAEHEFLSQHIVCYCGGLGWLPASEK